MDSCHKICRWTEPDPCCHTQHLRYLRSQKTMSSRPSQFASKTGDETPGLFLCSSWCFVSRFRRKLRGTTGHRLLCSDACFSLFESSQGPRIGVYICIISIYTHIYIYGSLRPYLWGRGFRLVIDYSALRWLHTMNDTIEGGPASRLMRWALKLAEYRFTIEHKPGALHKDADVSLFESSQGPRLKLGKPWGKAVRPNGLGAALRRVFSNEGRLCKKALRHYVSFIDGL